MRRVLYLSFFVLTAISLAGCLRPVQRAAQSQSVTGLVTYNVQPGMPTGALVTAQLRNVTQGVANSPLLDQQAIATNGNPPPYAFEIPFSPAAINQSDDYVIFAFIQDAAGHTIFTSDAPVPVLTKGNLMTGVEVPVAPVDRAPGITTDQEQAVASGLTAGLWEVVSLGDAAPSAETAITAQFNSDGTLSGSDGCNSYTANFAVNGTEISIQPGASTMMACPEPAMTQASLYMAALAAARSFAIDGATMSLMDESGAVLLTYRIVDQSLAGTQWQAILFNSGSALVGVTDVQITAAFGADGQLSGFGGCNNYTATYSSQAANVIEIGPIAATQKACTEPANVMEQESQYLTALQSATGYQVQGQYLSLQNASGESAVQLQRTQ